MNIIPATAADFETIRRITQETIRTVYPRYYPAGAVDFFLAHHNDAAIERDIRKNIVFLCISDNGDAVGTVTVSGNEIGRLFVLPDRQEIARNNEFAVLDVSFSAKAIYLKRGYEAVGWHVIETETGDFLCFDEMRRKLR